MQKEKLHKKYDNKRLRALYKLYQEGNKDKTVKYVLEYMRDYPEDLGIQPLYINTLIYQNKLEEAKMMIEKNMKKMNYDYSIHLYMIAFKEGNYEVAYKLLKNVYGIIKEGTDFYDTFMVDEIFLAHKLGFIDKDSYVSDEYLLRQIVDYNEGLAVEFCKDNSWEDELNAEELFYKIKFLLPDSVPNVINRTKEVYFFEYPEIRNVDHKYNKLYKYIVVEVVRDTCNIVFMYPLSTNKKNKVVNKLSEERMAPLVKRKSQIDRFNQRYKRQK